MLDQFTQQLGNINGEAATWPAKKGSDSDSDGMLNLQARDDLVIQLNYAFTQFLVISFVFSAQ